MIERIRPMARHRAAGMACEQDAAPGVRRKAALLAAAVTLALGAPASAVAQDKVKLKVADSFPASHYAAKIVRKWIDDVAAASGNTVEFEYYGAEQLGKAKDMLTLVQSGVADIAYVAPSYVSEKMPLSSVAELPAMFDTSCQGTHAYWKLATGNGIIAQREMHANQVRLLFTMLGSPYQIHSTKKFEGLSGLAGQKLRSYGGHQDTALKELGAVPVRMPAPEMYEAVTRGTLDGVVIPYASVPSYKLQDLVKYSTDHMNFGSVAFNYVMSERKWKSLPAPVRAAFEKTAPPTVDSACKFLDKDAQDAYEKLKAAGVSMVKFSPADAKAVKDKLDGVPKIWASELDKRGKPGSEVLKAFQAAMKP